MAKAVKKLSARQESILAFVERYIDENGYPPTIREIGKECNISSTSVVNYNLNKLEEAGYLVRDGKVSRGLRLAGQPNIVTSSVVRVPLVGRIVASEPVPVPESDFSIFGDDAIIEVTRDMVPDIDDLFALEVTGDSMVDAMINDGDIVIMRPHQNAQNGDMVAVWLTDRGETTLKYLYWEQDRVRLQPANPTMSPIFIEDPSSVQVQGRVVAVIRHA
ncbi:MAG: repressor LexA [Chloroflexi bacterium]|nr:repressor LexA [Chloroflexota bacterium]